MHVADTFILVVINDKTILSRYLSKLSTSMHCGQALNLQRLIITNSNHSSTLRSV